jgi:hypothetical protein
MSISNGLFTLANTQQRVASQAAQVGGDLISGMFTPDINVNDPMSLQKAAQFQMNRGNVAGGQELMQQAEKVAADQAQGRIENIRKAFFQAEAQGKTEQFKNAMIDAGYADIVGELETEVMQRKVAKATGEATLDTAKVNQFKAQWAKAGEEGRRVLTEKAEREGLEGVVQELVREENKKVYDDSRRAYDQATLANKEAQKTIDKFPLATSQEELEQQLKLVPEEQQPYLVARTQERLAKREEVKTLFEKTPEDKDLSSSPILEAAGWTKEQYNTWKKSFGVKTANQEVKKAALKEPVVKDPKSKKLPTSTQIDAMANSVAVILNEGKSKMPWGGRVDIDDPEVVDIANRAAFLLANNQAANFDSAIAMAMGVETSTNKVTDLVKRFNDGQFPDISGLTPEEMVEYLQAIDK